MWDLVVFQRPHRKIAHVEARARVRIESMRQSRPAAETWSPLKPSVSAAGGKRVSGAASGDPLG